jgi:hypothetical protein
MQWVLRAQVGDREALELLLRSVVPSLRRYLAGLAGSTDSDDLLQDVMVIIIRKVGSLQDPQVFRPWMEKHEDDFHLDNLPTPEIHPLLHAAHLGNCADGYRRHSDQRDDETDPARDRARVQAGVVRRKGGPEGPPLRRSASTKVRLYV